MAVGQIGEAIEIQLCRAIELLDRIGHQRFSAATELTSRIAADR